MAIDPFAASEAEPHSVQSLLATARAAHPGLAQVISDRDIAAYLTELAGAAPAGAQLGDHAADVYLAYGCARGLTAAIARFEALCIPTARAAILKIDARPEFVEDVLQELRTRLLCSADARTLPRIASYRGRGPLRGWVRAAAVRLALNRLRTQRRAGEVPKETPAESELSVVMAGDPELGFIRAHYRKAFQEAFAAALTQLSSRERTLLRMQLLDGLTEEQLGAMYGAHRVTIARWLKKARQDLLATTQRLLADRLGLPSGQLESITGLVPSRLDLSLSRLLRTP